MTSSLILAELEINPDIVVRGVGGITFGQTEDIVTDTSITIGSSACITACAAARLGADVGLVGVVGDDYFGEFISRRLIERGVNVTSVRIAAGQPTGSSVILVSADDQSNRHTLTH